jgi:hypothetical protein
MTHTAIPAALLAVLAIALDTLRGSEYFDDAHVAEIEEIGAGADVDALDAKAAILGKLRESAAAEISELDALRRRIGRMTASEYRDSGLARTWRCNKNFHIRTTGGAIAQKKAYLEALDAARTALSVNRPGVAERHAARTAEADRASDFVESLESEVIGYTEIEDGIAMPVYSEAGSAALAAELLG